MTTETHALDTPHFALLDRLVRRMEDDRHADPVTRAAVDVLTAAAAPDRAARLAVRPGEPVVLVQRLAVWALRRVPADVVAEAAHVLDRPIRLVPVEAPVPDAVAC